MTSETERAVGSDDASGRITFHIAVSLTGSPAGYGIFLDTDMNAQVQDQTGRVVVLVATAGMVMPTVMTGADGSQVSVPVAASATATDLSVSFLKTDMGIDKGFAFWVMSVKDDASGSADDAPDNGMWPYILTGQTTTTTTSTTTVQTVKAVIGAPTLVPKTAVAGKRLTVTFPVTRSDNGAPLTSGKMICDPSVSGKVITHAESFTGGTAKLAFTVPKTAKGKLLRVKVTIKSGDQSTTKIATFHIS